MRHYSRRINLKQTQTHDLPARLFKDTALLNPVGRFLTVPAELRANLQKAWAVLPYLC